MGMEQTDDEGKGGLGERVASSRIAGEFEDKQLTTGNLSAKINKKRSTCAHIIDED